MRIRIGTRFSALALWQAEHISGALKQHGHEVELVKITTSGDVSTAPLGSTGGTGLFTKEIQRALLDNRCDVAVHSLKDLPTAPIPGLCLASVPPREDPADAWIAKDKVSIHDLAPGAKVGTGSPRRRAQLLQARPDLQLLDIRGNVDTRLKKLESGEFDAILLAYAGLFRLGWSDRITQKIDFDLMLPAVGQAALGLETRAEDSVREALKPLNDSKTHFAVHCERTLLFHLQAGCLAPVAVLGEWRSESEFRLRCRVFSPDFSKKVEFDRVFSPSLPSADGSLPEAAEIASIAFEVLASLGARELIVH